MRKAMVRVQKLRKQYGSTMAADDVTFEVYQGEIFGMIGPNGAGKTTTIECVEGLREPDRGELKVLDFHPLKDAYRLKPRIGVQLQESALPDRIKVWEALDLYRSFYPETIGSEILLDRLGLTELRDRVFAKLSGGQKQRLFIALALIHNPEMVFLDELTTGLDPQARRAIWDLIRQIREEGKTVFLTTHFMDEAEYLCDRIAVMDHGRIVALDSPENLVRNLGMENRVVFTPLGKFDVEKMRALKSVSRLDDKEGCVVAHGSGDLLIADIVNFLTSHHIRFRDLRTEQPDLEDVFLKMTGKSIRN
jgi:ABC-2 type transport system ATP-binding protein